MIERAHERTTAVIERDGPIRNHQDAAARLDDAQYFAWCQAEARKMFESLLAKRFPHLVKVRPQR